MTQLRALAETLHWENCNFALINWTGREIYTNTTFRE
jgi:hypothetical protein